MCGAVVTGDFILLSVECQYCLASCSVVVDTYFSTRAAHKWQTTKPLWGRKGCLTVAILMLCLFKGESKGEWVWCAFKMAAEQDTLRKKSNNVFISEQALED